MDKLTFGDIKVGEVFIDFPTDGDNEGHGGFLPGHVLYKKRNNVSATRFFHPKGQGISEFPDDMTVIKVV